MECVAREVLHAHLHLCPPAQCAALAQNSECDIALIPVANLPLMPKNTEVITNYCISSTGRVDTVVMVSDEELLNIKKVYLDPHSRTSVALCQVLCREYWGITPQFCDGLPAELAQGEALVAIGDKVFDLEGKYAQQWDLSEQWQKFTGLPFVFAVWVALTPKGKENQRVLDEALRYGTSHIEQAIDSVCEADDPLRPRYVDYLCHKIEYDLTPEKLNALELFASKITKQSNNDNTIP